MKRLSLLLITLLIASLGGLTPAVLPVAPAHASGCDKAGQWVGLPNINDQWQSDASGQCIVVPESRTVSDGDPAISAGDQVNVTSGLAVAAGTTWTIPDGVSMWVTLQNLAQGWYDGIKVDGQMFIGNGNVSINQGNGILVNGVLNMKGTSITGSPGLGGGIVFAKGGNGTLDGIDFNGGGYFVPGSDCGTEGGCSYQIDVNGGTPLIENSNLHDVNTYSGSGGINVENGGDPTLLNDTFAKEAGAGVMYQTQPNFNHISGLGGTDGSAIVDVASSYTYTGTVPLNAGIPIRFNSGAEFAAGSTATVAAGQQVRFMSNAVIDAGAVFTANAGSLLSINGNSSICNSGELDLSGAAGSPVSVNGGGTVNYLSGSTGTADHVSFSNLGYYGNCGITSTIGLFIDGASPTITNSSFTSPATDATYYALVTNGGQPVFHHDSFDTAATFALAVAGGDTAPVVDATHNDWGDPSGPSGVGSGKGGKVSGNVTVAPWIGTPSTPQNLSATPGTGLGTITWSPATADPDLASYTVTVTDPNGAPAGTIGSCAETAAGCTLDPATACSAGTCSVEIDGLQNNVAYTVAVHGTNADGNGPDVTASVTPALPHSNTALSSSTNPSVYGQEVTYTATITAGQIYYRPSRKGAASTPTGTVAFQNNGTAIPGCESVTLVGGSATCTTSVVSSPAGADNAVEAQYSGDSNFQPSDNGLYQTVNQAATTLSLNVDHATITAGQTATFTATPAVTAPGSGTPTGTVAFYSDGANLDSCSAQPLQNGVATCATSSLSQGSHSITAVYSGDSNVASSTADALTETVNAATPPPVTTFSVSPAPNAAGWNRGSVTLHFAATDAGGPGIAHTYYSIDVATCVPGNTATCLVYNPASPPQITVEGTHTVNYFSVDTSGTPDANGPLTATVKIDMAAPTTTIYQSGCGSSVDVALQATDNRSGVAATYYTLNGGPTQTYNNQFITLTKTTTLAYWSVDLAGNTEGHHSTTITVSAATLSGVAPTSGVVGSQAQVTGTNYTAPVTLYLDSTSSPSIGTATPGSTCGFSTSVTIPAATYGAHRIIAQQQGSTATQTIPFKVLASVQPLGTGPLQPGAVTTLGASGFKANETVTAYWNKVGSSSKVGSGSVNSSGTATALSMTVPKTAAFGPNTIIVVGNASKAQARTQVQVVPSLTATPGSGKGGSTAKLVGAGFTPGETVQLYWNCTGAPCSTALSPASVKATSTGGFTVKSAAIPKVGIGTYSIGAIGSTSGGFATATFKVTG